MASHNETLGTNSFAPPLVLSLSLSLYLSFLFPD